MTEKQKHLPLPDHLAEEITVLRGTMITEQYAKAEYLFVLLEGKVNFYINIEEKPKPLLVGRLCRSHAPIGWSGLNLPNRYTSTIKVSSKSARLLKFDRLFLEKHFLDRPDEAICFYQWLNEASRILIDETAQFLTGTYPAYPPNYFPSSPERLPDDLSETITTLQKSPFFEVFEEQFFKEILKDSQKKLFPAGQMIYQQGDYTEDLMVLQDGTVDISFTNDVGHATQFRSIANAGYIVGWSGLINQKNSVTAIARTPVEIIFISKKVLTEILAEDKSLAMRFYRRILWLITHQLQTLRARLVMKKYEQEWLSIQSLIEQNATRLNLDSPLHKLPMLLKSPLTLSDGFGMLETMRSTGNSLERYIANNSIDILGETYKEKCFYQSLIEVYQQVSSLPNETPALEARKACAISVSKAFEYVDYQVEGWENLPESGGHIFIYNHLKNHEYNTLPNKFQITLDSHFLSAKVLYEKYGDPGLRIVRIGRGSEYGHQDYYERLGHINVFTPESDAVKLTPEEKKALREDFYRQATHEISQGRNLIISPEGTSYHTEDSPGPFKPGAFHLALNIDPAPWIVPISMINFDRRARHNIFRCQIHKPFKVSDHLSRSCSKEEMSDFLNNYQKQFKGFVREALERSEFPMATKRATA